jgi:hypothetical protein
MQKRGMCTLDIDVPVTSKPIVKNSNICTVKSSKIGGGLSKPAIYLARGLTSSHKKVAIIKPVASIMPVSDQIDITITLSWAQRGSSNRRG